MSKGSSYWGTATGKIGNTVVRVRKGTRVESMYQPNVANPRTEAQVYQRGKFQDAVGFYKRAVANFFRLAFEDKKSNETDYNAFMRYNVSNARVYSKQMISAASPGIPYMGEWIMSAGSLSAPKVTEDGEGCLWFGVNLDAPYSETSTMGQLFGGLIKDHPTIQNGDILTIVRIITGADSASYDELMDPSAGLIPAINIGEEYQGAPVWCIDQYIIDTTSAALIKDQRWFGAHSEGAFLLDMVSPIPSSFDSALHATAATVIVSRKTASGLLTSNSVLTWNSVGKTMLNDMATDNWLQGQRKAWGSSDVILAGALV